MGGRITGYTGHGAIPGWQCPGELKAADCGCPKRLWIHLGSVRNRPGMAAGSRDDPEEINILILLSLLVDSRDGMGAATYSHQWGRESSPPAVSAQASHRAMPCLG